MPELPEVETIRRGLEPAITGQIISDVEVVFTKSFDAGLDYIATHLAGQMVKSVTRRGKVLIINLDNEHSLLIHLKMTGQLVLDKAKIGKGQPGSLRLSESKEESKRGLKGKKLPRGSTGDSDEGGAKSDAGAAGSAGWQGAAAQNVWRFAGGHPTKSMGGILPDSSTRVIFTFANSDKLFFNDQRKFGWIKLVPTKEVELDTLLMRLGPEPLLETFKLEEFIERVKKRHAPIKAVLLDQTTLAGLGNIYVDEALHLAKIHPHTVASHLVRDKLKQLYEAIIKILNTSIDLGGTSFTNYVNILGLKGNYLHSARVFKRQGQPCLECGTTIEKIRVAGRGTHICPTCQKL